MRILFLATDAFGGQGGIAQSNRDFLLALSKFAACEEIVVLSRLAPEAPGLIPPKVRNDAGGLGGKWNYGRAFARLMGRGFDLVICAHINLLAFALLQQKLFGTPFILFIYGIDVWQPSFFARRLARQSAGVVSVSAISMERFQTWAGVPANRTWVVPNCAHLERFSPGPRDPVLVARHHLAGRRVLMTLGRLSAAERYKGVDEIMGVLPALLKKFPDLVYLVVGDGTDRARLEQKRTDLGLGDRVIFTGRIPEEEKVAHYRLADAFALTGFAEGFGIVCLEALACGIPVIGSTLDGTREALRNGELGLLADPGDPGDLAEKLAQALGNPSRIPPEGLSYFSEENYTVRCHAMMNQFVEGRT